MLDISTKIKESKMDREKYKGFHLKARANELQNNLGWSPELIIEKHCGDSVKAAEITIVHGVFGTRKEAIEAALSHGRKGIDQGFQLKCPVEE
jgi:hypothetical protein